MAGWFMRKIVVVDDELYNRILLEDILKNFTDEYEIISAASGEAALDIILRDEPVLVFLDIMLPDISGLDLIKCIRARREVCNTKFVLTTGCDPSNIGITIEDGIDTIIYKPFLANKILQVINKLTGSNIN